MASCDHTRGRLFFLPVVVAGAVIVVAVKTTERPIRLSPEFIRAVLCGDKTQHRELISCYCNGIHLNRLLGDWSLSEPPHTWPGENDEPDRAPWGWLSGAGPKHGDFVEQFQTDVDDYASARVVCPFGKIGDQLWVRETWGTGTRPCPNEGWYDGLEYRADDFELDRRDSLPLYRVEPPDGVDLDQYTGRWQQANHMPRWASRILLTIKDIRIERLQDITEETAAAEGSEHCPVPGILRSSTGDVIEPKNCSATNKERYRHLWIKRVGETMWNLNPWLWVIEWDKCSDPVSGVVS